MPSSRILRLVALAVVVSISARTRAAPPPAGLVLHNGNIVTLDQNSPRAEALAARGGRIAAIGSEGRIADYIGPNTRVIDLKGRTAVPGFIEGHGHFMSLGYARMNLDLTRSRNWAEIVAMVAEAARKAKPGEWIVGRGWHQSKWEQKPEPNVAGYPTHPALSKQTPDNPVMLEHASGHALFANAAAMKAAGITRGTPDPEGGRIMRDGRGEPTGVFRETAQAPVETAYARWRSGRSDSQREAEAMKAVALATGECLSKGVTSFQDAGSTFATVDRFCRLADEGKLRVRMWVMLREPNRRLRRRMADYRMTDYAGDMLTVRAIKRMADGALGSHGALLLEPYADMPGTSGLRVDRLETIRETAVLAARHDFQLCVHAIGDRANREVLDLFQEMYRSFPEKQDRRWRIEHAQHLHPADISRFAEIGVIASMQAVHCTSDAPFVVKRLGEERARSGAYAWRSLIDSGATIVNGTDAPVEDVDPLACFRAAVTRRLPDGSTFFPRQCMTRIEALESYTKNAAYAAFEEKQKGTLTAGKLADVVVLSHDVLTVPEETLSETVVLYTIIGGKVVFERE